MNPAMNCIISRQFPFLQRDVLIGMSRKMRILVPTTNSLNTFNSIRFITKFAPHDKFDDSMQTKTKSDATCHIPNQKHTNTNRNL